jgi:hypothetical protein
VDGYSSAPTAAFLIQRVGDALNEELIALQQQRIHLFKKFMSKSSLACDHLNEEASAVKPSASSELQSVVSTVKTNRKRKPSEGAKQLKMSKGASLVLEPTNAIADVQPLQCTATAPAPAMHCYCSRPCHK